MSTRIFLSIRNKIFKGALKIMSKAAMALIEIANHLVLNVSFISLEKWANRKK